MGEQDGVLASRWVGTCVCGLTAKVWEGGERCCGSRAKQAQHWRQTAVVLQPSCGCCGVDVSWLAVLTVYKASCDAARWCMLLLRLVRMHACSYLDLLCPICLWRAGLASAADNLSGSSTMRKASAA